MADWKPIAIDTKLFTNVRETALKKANAAIENAFINEAGGHTRFPGLQAVVTLLGAGVAPTYLSEWQGNLIATSNSRIFRMDQSENVLDVTGVPLSGDGRAVFDKTDNELVFCAGAEILRLAGNQTEILSPDAPLSTHVGYIDGFLLAIERFSGRFQHCDVDDFRTWDPLNTFAANGKPDDLNAMIVTPYREIIMTGLESVEQFERLSSGTTPFFRRWATGEGILAPYTLLAEDQGTFGMNKDFEFVRFSGQTSQPASDDVGRSFESVDDWTHAWAVPIRILGQKFVLLQIPRATNPYGTKGLTFLYEFRSKKWFNLYGWDADAALPARWPGWSYQRLWNRHFVGGNGKILELVEGVYTNDGAVQRILGRTAHMDSWGEANVQNVRMRIHRGVGDVNAEKPPTIALRAIRDNKHTTRWHHKSLGAPGETDLEIDFGPMGFARTWQFEWQCTENVLIDLHGLAALVERADNR